MSMEYFNATCPKCNWNMRFSIGSHGGISKVVFEDKQESSEGIDESKSPLKCQY